MDKTLALQAELRERIGSKAAAAVRKQGRIPGIVYGHKEQPVAISLDAHDFLEGVHHGHRLMDITINGDHGKDAHQGPAVRSPRPRRSSTWT